MSYPEIEQREIERLKEHAGREITLLMYTSAYHFPSRPVTQVPRDDWEQYGGHPTHNPSSIETIKTILVAVLGKKKEGQPFPEYIVGEEKGKLKIYPRRFEIISWVSSIHGEGKCLWSLPRGELSDKQQEIKQISEEEFEVLKKNLVQIVP